jgi:hypothetical protein
MNKIGDRKVTTNVTKSNIDYKQLAKVILEAYMKSRCIENEQKRDVSNTG